MTQHQSTDGHASARSVQLLHEASAAAGRLANMLIQRFPVVGVQATRKRNAIVLPPYQRRDSLVVLLLKTSFVVLLLGFCAIYGFAFALSAPFLVVPFAIPVAVLGALCVWALPDVRNAPTFGLELLMPAYFIAILLWPSYLAIALPGLPWITLMRLTGFPMAALLLVCLSVSQDFRREVGAGLRAIPLVSIFYFGFVGIEIGTIFLSDEPVSSAQKVFQHQVVWTTVLVISCALFRDIKYVERYFALLIAIAIPIMLVAFFEHYRRLVPWAGHIPPLLQVPDEVISRVLQPQIREYVNRYRAKAMFNTPLAMAEYLALLTPLLLHFGLSSMRPVIKFAAWAMIPILYMAVASTDSRLGQVGMLASVVLYGLLWSAIRWRARRSDLLAAAILYGYPAVATVGVGLVFSSTRLRIKLLGDGAEASSNASRDWQLQAAIDALLRQPVGFGAGQSGAKLGFKPGSFITVDNYFVTVGMDFGFLGAFFWYGVFLIAIFTAVKYCLLPETAGRPEARLLAPLAVTLSAFLVIKWVHGQDDNHSVYFMMVGMILALVYRLRRDLARQEHRPIDRRLSGSAPTPARTGKTLSAL